MRWTAKASLLAGVAAMALVGGPTSHTISPEANGLRELVPLQLGTPAEAQARVSVGVFFDRLAPHGRWARHGSHGYVFMPAGLSRDWRHTLKGIGPIQTTMAGTGSRTNLSAGRPIIMVAGAIAAPTAGTGCRAMSGPRLG